MLNTDVWIFISSTFTDTKVERDLFIDDVYPYLRQYYRKVGYFFNVVDLRWGVREGATDEHETTDICSNELIRCRYRFD